MSAPTTERRLYVSERTLTERVYVWARSEEEAHCLHESEKFPEDAKETYRHDTEFDYEGTISPEDVPAEIRLWEAPPITGKCPECGEVHDLSAGPGIAPPSLTKVSDASHLNDQRNPDERTRPGARPTADLA